MWFVERQLRSVYLAVELFLWNIIAPQIYIPFCLFNIFFFNTFPIIVTGEYRLCNYYGRFSTVARVQNWSFFGTWFITQGTTETLNHQEAHILWETVTRESLGIHGRTLYPHVIKQVIRFPKISNLRRMAVYCWLHESPWRPTSI